VLYNAVVQRASTLKIIAGHTGTVTGVAFSPDGHRLATTGYDGVRLWNPDTGQQHPLHRSCPGLPIPADG
jgi:WD40 repeat protein